MTTTPTTTRRPPPPERRLWTRQEFDRAEELGLFGSEERLELIEGEILVKELPLNAPHAAAQRRVEKVLGHLFAEGFDVRGQLPLALDSHSKPLPDIAVVEGAAEDYETEHPTTALLLVEIADTTLRLDRTRKAGLYARAGIQEYWILNLQERVLEVYRQPESTRGRFYYASVTQYTEDESIAPLAAPMAGIAVTDLLPRPRN